MAVADKQVALTTCVVIQRGVAGDIVDTQIAANRPGENDGAMPVANVGVSGGGERRALLRADLSSIPSPARIESATLTLWQSNTGRAVVRAHEISAAWDENTATWSSVAGMFAPEVAAAADNRGPTYEGPIALDLTAPVQAWVMGTRPNHGILLEQDAGSATRIRTGKAGHTSHRPRLDVCYTPVAPLQGTTLFVQVLDTAGHAVPTASVTVGGTVRATDGTGRILLADLAPGRVVARIEARGFAPASMVMDLPEGAHAGTEVRLMPLGEPILFAAEDGAVIEQGAVRVSIPAGMLVDYKGEPVTGTVEATVVPLDPTTGMAHVPGPLEGVAAASGEVVSLESLAMAEVSLWQDGLPVHLAPGATATLELRLPEALAGQHQAGETIPAWWLDLDAGIWREEGAGTIQPATGDPGALAWVVEVSHFTWWNCDKPWTEKNCFDVVVLDRYGRPMAHEMVGATGVNYTGRSRPQATDAYGHTCVDIKLGGTASLFVGMESEPLATVLRTGSGPASDCAGNGAGCIPVTIVVLPGGKICMPGMSIPCSYSGPAGTDGVGLCQAPASSCNARGTAWSNCVGEVLPGQETCATVFDDDCDGEANEPTDGLGCECGPGDAIECYAGPADTLGVGICQAGERTCDTRIGRYGACEGQVLPLPESCATAEDDDCDGFTSCSTASLLALWSFQNEEGQISIDAQAVDSAGNFVLAGELDGTVDLGGGPLTNGGGFVVKLDASAQHVWSRQLGNDYNDVFSLRVVTGSAGNVLVVGTFTGWLDVGGGLFRSVREGDHFLLLLDASGNHVWSKHVKPMPNGRDGFGQLPIQDVAMDSAGNVLITGRLRDTVDMSGIVLGSPEQTVGVVIKLDAGGQLLWSRQFPSDEPWSPSIHALTVDSAGDVLAAGHFAGTVDFGGGPFTSATELDAFVLKLDAGGQHIWSRQFSSNSSWPLSIHELALDRAGNALVAGGVLGTVDFGNGPMTSINGDSDMFVVKLDTGGGHMWSHQVEHGSEYLHIRGLAADSAGNVLLTGDLEGVVDFGGGPIASPWWGSNGFVLKLSSSGLHEWSRGFSTGESFSRAEAMAVDDADSLLVLGWFYGTMDLGDGPVSPPGASGYFLSKFNP